MTDPETAQAPEFGQAAHANERLDALLKRFRKPRPGAIISPSASPVPKPAPVPDYTPPGHHSRPLEPEQPDKYPEKLHSPEDFGYPKRMHDEIDKLREFLRLSPLFKELNQESIETLVKVNIDFRAAACDDGAVALLLKVPKSALNSPTALVHIPTEFLSNEAAAQRRKAGTERVRAYRRSLSPEEREQQRTKDAMRKRLARQEAKNNLP